MLSVYQSQDCIYDKMVALSAIGNSGLQIAMDDLEKIIRDPQEAPVVRCKAIDGLRRLRASQSRRIQRILLPLYLNTREYPQLRAHAFGQLMNTQPDASVVDQLVFSIGQERNKQVQSFAYQTLKMLAKSQRPNDQNM